MNDSIEALESVEVAARTGVEGGLDPLLILSVVGGLLFCYGAWWVLRNPFEEDSEA